MTATAWTPVVAAAALLVAAWPWTARYDARPTVRALAALVATSYAVVVLQVGLGLAGALRPRPLLAATCLVAALAVAGALATGGGYRVTLRRPTVVGAALGVLCAAVYGVALCVGVLVPPYGWDSVVYHLTDVFHFAQRSSLEVFGFPGRAFFYPKVGELHSLWAYLLSGAGSESWRLVGLGLLPLGLTAGVATRAAAEGLGYRAALPWIVPGVALAPIMVIQPLAAYVDVAFAAFVLAAFAFAVLAAVEGRFGHLAWCAAACGLALGVKISFVYFGLPVAMVLLTPRAWSGLARDGARRLALRLGLCVLLVVGGAGYWLGRNWIATGNPIYPSRVRVAGITVLDGPKEIKSSTRQQEWFVDSAAGWLGYPFRETFNDVPRYTLENGFGPLFAAGSLAALAALAAALASGRWLEVRAHLAIPLTALCFVVVNPYKEPRYVIALCGFAVLGVAWVAERARAAGPTARRSLEMAVVAAIAFAALGGAVSVAPHLDRVVADWKRGTWSPERFYVLEYGAAGEAFNWVAENLRGETVSFTQSAFVAPLFGWHGTNRVIYASTGRDERIGRVPRVRHYGAWRRFLRENGVAWIVQWVPWWSGEGPTDRDAWIASHPEGFHLVREFEGRARIWQPIFGAGDAEAEAAPGIADLGRAATWRLEHTEGATVEVEGGGDGLRVRFTFGTSGNDWGDLRADLDGADWSASRAFAFDLDGETTTPAQLFVWLKGEDPRRAARYRVDASSLGRGPRRVEIPLAEPEWAAPGFTLRDVSEVHVVFEDEDDASRGEGRLVVTGFRLEPRQGIAAVPRPVEKNP